MTAFGDLADRGALYFSDGYRTKHDQLSEGGYRIIRAADVRDGRVHFDGTDFVGEDYEQAIGAKAVKAGDLVLTTKGTIGRVAMVDGVGEERAVYSPQICFFRFDEKVAHPRYMRYALQSPSVVRQIQVYSHSTDMAPYLSLRDIRAIDVTLPSLSGQRAIAGVLGALDDKIAANRDLVQMVGLLAAVLVEQSVQVDSFTDVVGSIVDFHNRRRVPLSKAQRESRAGDVPYYGATGVVGFVDEPLFDQPLVLVGEDGTVSTATGNAVVQYIRGPAWVNNHAHVLTGKKISVELLRYLLAAARVSESVTGAVQPKLSMGNLSKIQIKVPGDSERQGLEKTLRDLTEREMSAICENRLLAATRDELIPLLIDGRITVKEAEKRVEDVV